MLMLLSGATSYERNDQVGHLIVPKSWNKPEALGLHPNRWAMDNGAFVGFDPGSFMRMQPEQAVASLRDRIAQEVLEALEAERGDDEREAGSDGY